MSRYERDAPPPPNTRFGRAAQKSRYLTDENFTKLERWKAFAGARGHTIGELAVAWLLAHPVVCAVIAGATGPDQLTTNAKATQWTLTPDEVAAV